MFLFFDTQSISPFRCAAVPLVVAAGVSMVGHGVPVPCTKNAVYFLLNVAAGGT